MEFEKWSMRLRFEIEKWWKLEDEISWTKKPPMKTLEDIELEFRNEELWVRTNMLEHNTVRGWGSNKKAKIKVEF